MSDEKKQPHPDSRAAEGAATATAHRSLTELAEQIKAEQAAKAAQPAPQPTPQPIKKPAPAAPVPSAAQADAKAPQPVDLMQMFDIGSSEQMLIMYMPYKKALLDTREQLIQQERVIANRIREIEGSLLVVNKAIAEASLMGTGFAVKSRFEDPYPATACVDRKY